MEFIGWKPGAEEVDSWAEWVDKDQLYDEITGMRMADAAQLVELRGRTTLELFCSCSRAVAFLAWPTRARAVLWYAASRRREVLVWADQLPTSELVDFEAECPRCRRLTKLDLHLLADFVEAGPDATRRKLAASQPPQ